MAPGNTWGSVLVGISWRSLLELRPSPVSSSPYTIMVGISREGKKSRPSLVETGATGTQADTFSGDWKVLLVVVTTRLELQLCSAILKVSTGRLWGQIDPAGWTDWIWLGLFPPTED